MSKTQPRRELDPCDARARAVGNAVMLEHVGGCGDIAAWGMPSADGAEDVSGAINALLNGLRHSLADSARLAGEYAHEMRGRLERAERAGLEAEGLRDKLEDVQAERDCFHREANRLAVLLRRVVSNTEKRCRLDHHGFCQEHLFADPCPMPEAHAAVGGGLEYVPTKGRWAMISDVPETSVLNPRIGPTPMLRAFDLILSAADQHSELAPKAGQSRTVLLSGECHEIVAFMERQSVRIKELEADVRQAQAEAGASHSGLLQEVARADAAFSENDRLREALTWAVGFIQCNYPKAAAEYPDFRNACDLIETAGKILTGEFMRAIYAAEQAEEDAARLRAGLELLSQIRHVSGNAQAAFRCNLRTVDAILAGADMRRLETVEAVAAGTWKPKEGAG